MRVSFVTIAAALLAALVVAPPAPVHAAGDTPDPALLAAARKEGSLTLYGSMTAPQLQQIAERFEAKYGIRVDTLRLESNALPARIAIEARAGAYHADVVDEPGFQIDLLKRQNLLQPFRAPQYDAMTAGTYDKDDYYASIFINTDTLAYNTNVLRAAGVKPPTGWIDFTKPEWKGRFALFNGSYEWYAAMAKALGKEKADGYMRAYAANGVHMTSSHQIAETALEAGEYMGVINTYGYSMAADQARGLPIVEVNPNPTVIELHGIGLAAHPPHPNAARLFEEWTLSRETQSWIASPSGLGRISARRDVANNPAIWGPKIRYVISDPADSVHYADFARDFNAIFSGGGQ